MFVSSYSTHINTNNSQKVSKQEFERQEADAKAFSSKLSAASQTPSLKNSSIPVNYISQSLVLNNKQELQKKQDDIKDTKKDDLHKFTQSNSVINAKSAYEGNAKMFSLFKIPAVALNQTPSIENTLPKEPQDIRELNMRHKMLNTYIANDNYYRVTA